MMTETLKTFRLLVLLILLLFESSADLAEFDSTEMSNASCSSHCTLLFDNHLGCWNKTLEYFTEMVVGISKRYIATQVTIVNITKTHGEIDYTQMVEDSTKALNQVKPPDYEDDASSIPSEVTNREMVKTLVDRVKNLAADDVPMPFLDCPNACERKSHVWRYLLFGSAAFNVLLAMAIIAFVYVLSRRDRIDENEMLVSDEKENGKNRQRRRRIASVTSQNE